MKNKKSFWGLMALVLMFGVIVMGCDDGNDGNDGNGGDQGKLPVKTIKWKTDGNGYTQFYTNDTANYGYGFFSGTNHIGNTYEAEVKKVSGNADYGYGMLFCFDTDISSFYCILITTTGYYQIHKCVNGVWAETPIRAWTTSVALNTGYNQTNKLKVVKSGSSFTVSINDTEIAPFNDSEITGTKIGTYVSVGKAEDESFPNTPVDVRFKLLQ